MTFLSPRPWALASSLPLLATLTLFPYTIVAQDDPFGVGASGHGNIPDSDSTPAPSVDGSNDKTLYLIALVALVILGLCVAAIVIRRRRKYATIHARARRVSDMEAARSQHALSAWRAGRWHGESGIPLASRGPAVATGPGANRRSNMPNFFRTRGNPAVEGLNENGEAPPPYSPPDPKNTADKETFTTDAGRRDSSTTVAGTTTGTPSLVSRGEPMAPKYEETELARPGPAHTRERENNQDR